MVGLLGRSCGSPSTTRPQPLRLPKRHGSGGYRSNLAGPSAAPARTGWRLRRAAPGHLAAAAPGRGHGGRRGRARNRLRHKDAQGHLPLMPLRMPS